MKLFYASGSSSLLPHIVLLGASLPFTAVKIDEHTKAIEGGGDYRKVNPWTTYRPWCSMTAPCSRKGLPSCNTLPIRYRPRDWRHPTA